MEQQLDMQDASGLQPNDGEDRLQPIDRAPKRLERLDERAGGLGHSRDRALGASNNHDAGESAVPTTMQQSQRVLLLRRQDDCGAWLAYERQHLE